MSAKKYLGLALILSLGLSVTGCGEKFPEMTQEQYDQTVEYAVGLLMKYSVNGESKLAYVDPAEAEALLEIEKQKQEEELANSFREDNLSGLSGDNENPDAENDEDEEGGESGENGGNVSSEDSSFDGEDSEQGGSSESDASGKPGSAGSDSDNESGSGSGAGSYDPDAVVISSDESREIMDDIFLSYQGYSISSTYPESSKSYVVNSDKGKKLLVLRFDLYNASDNAKNVNMLKLNLLFQILLNGKNLGYTSVTFLPNDLSSYIGTIESRAHESLVVLTQIDEKSTSNVETLGLIVTRDGKDTKVVLK